MRLTKGQTRSRRSHHGLEAPRLSTCANCEAKHLRHRMCDECGTYRGKVAVDVKAQREKEAGRLLRKRRRMGLEDEKETSETASE